MDTSGNTPLHHAAEQGDVSAVVRLVRGGADVNQQNNVGATALVYAALGGKIEAVKQLLMLRADPRLTTRKGKTALVVAQEKGYAEVVNLIQAAMSGSAPTAVRKLAEDKRWDELLAMLKREECNVNEGGLVRVAPFCSPPVHHFARHLLWLKPPCVGECNRPATPSARPLHPQQTANSRPAHSLGAHSTTPITAHCTTMCLAIHPSSCCTHDATQTSSYHPLDWRSPCVLSPSLILFPPPLSQRLFPQRPPSHSYAA